MESTDAGNRGGLTRSSEEVPVMGMERRVWIVQLYLIDQPEMGGIFWVKQSRIVEGSPSEGGTLPRTDSLSPATAVRTLDGWLSTIGWTIEAG
jgi:hypothetical protein